MSISSGSRLGPYEILAPIGAGGMGEVWRARDPRLGRDVAIKVLPASFSADADRLRRFEQEARAAGILNHPNITAVLDIGEHDGAPYVVQELLEGETLRQALAGGLSPRKAIDHAIQIAHGLAAAHEKGIVHRDLKPENVFITRDGRLKILDFGLAKLTHTEEGSQATNLPTATAGTEPGMVLGTLGYMSPEQVRGRPADARSDIFSFGAILYEMLAGQRAFKGDSAADTMSAILKEDPPDLAVTNRNIAPGVERIVRHCLEKNPEQRFQSARDLAFDLEALSGISAPATPPIGEGSAPVRSRRVPVPAALGAAILLAAGAYFTGSRLARRGRTEEISFRQVTFKNQPIFNARFAPDGQTVVFSTAPNGNAPEIFSWRPDSPGAVSRGLQRVHLLAVSSRGELAVLTNARFLRHKMFLGTLARMPLEGGAPRELANEIREADWSPDGTELAVTRNVGGKDRLEFPLGKVLLETGGYFSDIRFSPDGKRIAFFEHPIRFDDRGNIGVVDLAGKKTLLSEGYWSEEGLAWSKDGREIVFSAGSGYNLFKIFAVDLSGRRRTALQSAGGLTIHDLSKEGLWATSRDDHFKDISALPPGSTQERDLSWLELTWPVALTPDGKTLLFTEDSPSAGPYYSTCVRATDGSPAVRLGDGTALDLSEDGKSALAVIPTNPDRLVIYPTGAGQTRTIPSGGIVTYESARFFPDGRRILLCGHEKDRGVRCYVQGIEDSKLRPVTPEGTSAGFVSPDGRQIVVRSPRGLEVLPSEGGEGRVIPGAGDDTVVRWAPDGKSLLVSPPWEVPQSVSRLDLTTGRREPFRIFGPPDLTGAVGIYPIVISDDMKVYAYGTRRMHSHLFLVDGAR
ncbi:MAG: protein kinase [Acidobacteriota bacterium]|nr:protein kinase [Acidobacteriota bacterium]